MQEIWKDVKGYEGLYQVSNLGRVKSFKRKNEAILKPYKIKGYPSVDLRKDGKRWTIKVHQLVAVAFLNHEICGMKMVVDHINYDITDNRVENLQLLTNRENCSKDKLSKSGLTGVSWNKEKKKWYSRINVNGKNLYLGRFENKFDASRAYKEKLKEITSKQINK